ncbi:hypothetical protein CTheo_7631 [Ceratobasidium theobromae]|uniref:Uncharacterized protein n=1 Tax=Ceratobasidium theobromae TaxID=1582974 RepID=A0A5N5QAY2_9AGAM|nr:hypothetical protein CTheo_7631 [Ceratobasidium theobromae]
MSDQAKDQNKKGIRTDKFYAYCTIYGVLGVPKKIDRRGLNRHLKTFTHELNRERIARASWKSKTKGSHHSPIPSIEAITSRDRSSYKTSSSSLNFAGPSEASHTENSGRVHSQAGASTTYTTSANENSQTEQAYATLCCEEFDLTGIDKEDVSTQLPPHFIIVRQYARILSLTHSFQQMSAESFLNSSEFKDHVIQRIQATFLDPNLQAYVRGSTSCLIRHMELNPSSWNILSAFCENLSSKAFAKAVSTISSSFRGEMTRKFKKSVVDKLDIGTLAKSLCIERYHPTLEHWIRFAFIRVYMLDWEKIPVEPSRSRIGFWSFIDSKLDKLYQRCSNAGDKAQRVREWLLKTNLKKDQEMFSGLTSGRTQLPGSIQLSEWQKSHSIVVADMSTYQITRNRGGDEAGDTDDDDENSPNLARYVNGKYDKNGQANRREVGHTDTNTLRAESSHEDHTSFHTALAPSPSLSQVAVVSGLHSAGKAVVDPQASSMSETQRQDQART